MRIAHDDGKARTHKAAFRKNRMAHAVSTYVEKVFDMLPVRPIAQDFSLRRRFAVFCRSDVIDNRFDFIAVEYAVFSAFDQIGDRDGSRDFVAKYAVEFQYRCTGKGRIDSVRIEYFLCYCFTHTAPRVFLISLNNYSIIKIDTGVKKAAETLVEYIDTERSNRSVDRSHYGFIAVIDEHLRLLGRSRNACDAAYRAHRIFNFFCSIAVEHAGDVNLFLHF